MLLNFSHFCQASVGFNGICVKKGIRKFKVVSASGQVRDPDEGGLWPWLKAGETVSQWWTMKGSPMARRKGGKASDKCPEPKAFHWAKDKIRELYHKPGRTEIARLVENVMLNLKAADDAELIRRSNTVEHSKKLILSRFDSRTTNLAEASL